MIKGFKDFLLRGNVVDLAVAVVIGAAYVFLRSAAGWANATDTQKITGTVMSMYARSLSLSDNATGLYAFGGILAARLARGDDLVTASRVATVGASFAVQRQGTAESYPDADELDALIASLGPVPR